MRPTTDIEQMRAVRVYNGSGEIIPPGAAVYLSSADENGVFTGTKPATDNLTEVVFNGPVQIPIGGKGVCYAESITLASLNSSDATPVAGDTRGVQANDWNLRDGKTGFRILSATSDNRFAMVSRQGWSGSTSGGTSGADGCGWTAGLTTSDCLIVSSASATSFILSTSDALTWNNSGEALTICGADYRVQFIRNDCTGPCLTLTTITGSATTYNGTRTACGCTYAEFAFPMRSLCPLTTRDSRGPCYDTVTVRVDWTCCPITGWDGAGWYCVTTAAGLCADAIALALTESDKCDTDIKICSGPYANQAAAEAVCGAVTTITVVCGATSYDIPSVVYAKCTGSIAGLGTVKLTWDGVSQWEALSLPSGCGVLTSIKWDPCASFVLAGATSNFGNFNPTQPGCSSYPGFCGFTTSPLRWAGVGTLLGTCSGTGKVEITETP